MPKKPSSGVGSEPSWPEPVRPYIFHGVNLEMPKSGREALGDCPFCGKEGKFSVNTETSKFQCWGGSCQVTGNSTVFLRMFWEHCREATTTRDYQRLADESGFLKPHAARSFGCCLSTLKNQWLVPGWNADGNLTGLYRYGKIMDKGGWRDRLLSCPGTGQHLFNLQNYDSAKPIVDLCEGWRDGIAWIESLSLTTKGGVSYIDSRSVLCIPGTNSFKPAWCKYFAGKTVNILFDNDHPKDSKEGAGIKGVKKVASILLSSRTPPEKINFMAWNGSLDGYSLDLPDSMDLRDLKKEESNA